MWKRSSRQRWSDDDGRIRVLLECEPAASPDVIAWIIEREGYAVRTCEGPTCTRCPLLERGSCPLVDGADVVVNMLGTTPPEHEVLDTMKALDHAPPIADEMGKVWTLSRQRLMNDIQQALAGLPT